MLFVFSDKNSPRLKYTLDLMVKQLLGIHYTLVDNLNDIPSEAAILNYSEHPVRNSLQIIPSDLLFSSRIQFYQDIRIAEPEGKIRMYIGEEEVFDPLAASFYLVSRYEEYQDFKPDAHNRYPAEESVLVRTGLIKRPVVNEWAHEIKDELARRFPNLRISPAEFNYISTIDVDQAWKYRHKGFFRNLGGFFGDIFRFDWYKVKERTAVLTGMRKDPFNNFEIQKGLHETYGIKPRYFIALGRRSTHDKNLPGKNKRFRKLIRQLDIQGIVGIHPSYTSNTNPGELADEKKEMEDILGRKVTMSRQHFLMHKMPDTYNRLHSLGITEDHTMGYSTHLGFRAGIAAPFPYYDLMNDRTTELILIPFSMMDITPMHYMKLDVDEAKSELTKLIQTTKDVGGTFVSLWHNESLSNVERWDGWRELYVHILKECSAS